MAFKPTLTQESAINTDGNILVSAAAGSGKTAVLTRRVIRKLTDKSSPVSADRLLVVTFTNAAANEMRSRIESELNLECAKNPDDIGLLKQRHLISSAKICTIDSFCIDLVRENFEKCGISPDFKVSDGTELADIDKKVMSDIINRHLEKGSDEFKFLLQLTGCEYSEENLAKTVNDIFLYSRQLPFPENFLENLSILYKKPFDKDNILFSSAFDFAKGQLMLAQNTVTKMCDTALLLEKGSEKCIVFAQNISFMISALLDTANTLNWDKFYSLLKESGFPRMPSTSKEDANAEEFKMLKEEILGIIGKIKNYFSLSVKENEALNSKIYPSVKLLCDIINEYAVTLFEEYKKENTFTFYNTEQLALTLLCEYKDGKVVIKSECEEYLNRYDEVLVDEFQDVNDLQNMLFYVLSGNEKRLFAVGDVKQSIYGFRGSNPDNFLRKKESYIPIEIAKPDEPKKIILCDNFRSKKGICDFVNYFFSIMMSNELGGMVYGKEDMLNAAACFPDTEFPDTELLVVSKEDEDSLLLSEAKCIAKYITDTVNKDNTLRGNDGILRRANYGDFAILLNTVQDKADTIANELKSQGIPVLYNAQKFTETVEISTFLSLLKIIDNPRSDIEMLTAMMSPIFGFEAEEIAVIRSKNKNCDLLTSVIENANDGNKHCKDFLENLYKMRREATVLPIDELIVKLFTITDYLNTVSLMPSGKNRRANLLSLLKYAIQYKSTGKYGLNGFIKFVNTVCEKGSKSTVASSDNAVKIMSMHSSKGLQFPICIIANLSSKINKDDSIGRVLYTDKYGLAIKYYDEETEKDIETLSHCITARYSAIKNIQERLRLLYVAMTRAEERLVLVSSMKDASKKLSKISSKLSQNAPYVTAQWLESTSSMNDWVLAASLLHPDGEMLRRISDSHINTISTNSKLAVSFVKPENFQVIADEHTEKGQALDENICKQIESNVNYKYPYDVLTGITAKASVSQIANKAESERFAFTARPSFMQKDGLTATGRGTATHRIMQYIDMKAKPDVDAEIERLKEWQFITEQEANAVDINAVKLFFESDIFKRILNSSNLRREMKFLTEIPACKLDSSLTGDLANTPILVQGAVDLCFTENGTVTVLDFKTDRADSEKDLTDAYSEQLNIYAKACEKIFGLPIKEKLIYSFSLSKTIRIK